jgi:hypothetical protein
MHLTEGLRLEVGRTLSPRITLPKVDPPLDLVKGCYTMDVFRDGKHVALCLWIEERGKFAIDFLPENLDEVGYENPSYCEPYFDTVEEVVDALAKRLA